MLKDNRAPESGLQLNGTGQKRRASIGDQPDQLRKKQCAQPAIALCEKDTTPVEQLCHITSVHRRNIDTGFEIGISNEALIIASGSRNFNNPSLRSTTGDIDINSSTVCTDGLPSQALLDTCAFPASTIKKDGCLGCATPHGAHNCATHDTCFGTLVINVMITPHSSKAYESKLLHMKAFGGLIKLSYQENNKYAGIIPLPALHKLLDMSRIELAAYLPGLPGGQQSSSRQWSQPQSQETTIRIVVHGCRDVGNLIGDMLSDDGLYLQQPLVAECAQSAEYFNPHYLVRPGSEMPALDELTLSCERETTASSENLDEVNKHRLKQIFDLANNDSRCVVFEQSSRLVTILKTHQLTALAMMTEKECEVVERTQFPSLWQTMTSGSQRYRHIVTGFRTESPTLVKGGILADDMGLGKTLSILALICWSLDIQSTRQATLIVTPKSTLPGWQDQIKRHIHAKSIKVLVFHGSTRRQTSKSLNAYDIVLTTYETLRSDWSKSKSLFDEGWYRVVLDEAHHIRNRSSQIFKAACEIPSHYRWCVTGTPVHNSLDDYGALLSFIRVAQFTDKSMFDSWITNPIRYKKLYALDTLKSLVKATCLRRTKSSIGDVLNLPNRTEEVEYVQLHETDQELYDFFKKKTADIAAGVSGNEPKVGIKDKSRESNILSLLNFLRLICNHGQQLLPASAVEAWNARDYTAIDWQMMRNSRKACAVCETSFDDLGSTTSGGSTYSCLHVICATCAASEAFSTTGGKTKCPKCGTLSRAIKCKSPLPTTTGHYDPSAKVAALLRNLRADRTSSDELSLKAPNKSVILSYWVKMLNLIQQALESQNYNICRIDGSSSLGERRSVLNRFNQDPKCTIMLASIGSAGEGIDLTAANRIHLMEPHWSPMAEAQAVDRIHRIGQVREVVVRRYIVKNSIETYIQWVQQQKINLISQIEGSDNVSQSDVDLERWKALQANLE